MTRVDSGRILIRLAEDIVVSTRRVDEVSTTFFTPTVVVRTRSTTAG